MQERRVERTREVEQPVDDYVDDRTVQRPTGQVVSSAPYASVGTAPAAAAVDEVHATAYDPYANRRRSSYRLVQGIWLLFGIVEGILAIDTPIHHQSFLPIVSISGHDHVRGVTNIVLNHELAAHLAIEHLHRLGHRKIAVIKGQEFSSDTAIRLNTVLSAAREFGVQIENNWITQLIGDDPSPETGYRATKKLLSNSTEFTAVLAFNDISAIGAIRALRENGLNVPQDVSIIGFDDITAAEYHNPALTTIRQPLKKMGNLGAEYLLLNIQKNPADTLSVEITVEPALIVRQSTAAVSG